MRDSESFAMRCFEEACSPLRLREVGVQSHGEHDFDILGPSGTCVGVLEVTTAADHGYVSTMSAVFDSKYGSGVAPRRASNACWSVTATRNVQMKRVRSQLDVYLSAIEQAGLTAFDAATRLPEVAAIRKDLKIGSGHVYSHDVASVHFVAPPPLTAWTDASAVNKAIAVEAAKRDNLRKLSRPEYEHRHLFVFVDMSALGAHAAMQHHEASPEPPLVDPIITHLWAGSPQQGHVGIFWHAQNGGQWTRGKVSIVDWPDVEFGA